MERDQGRRPGDAASEDDACPSHSSRPSGLRTPQAKDPQEVEGLVAERPDPPGQGHVRSGDSAVSKPPTKRQLEVVQAIEALTEDKGYPPTTRELGDALGIRSTNAMTDHLKALRKKGLVTWKPRCSRTLRVVGSDEVDLTAASGPRTCPGPPPPEQP